MISKKGKMNLTFVLGSAAPILLVLRYDLIWMITAGMLSSLGWSLNSPEESRKYK
jgi:hypothetical protein